MPLFKLLCGFRLLVGPYWYVHYVSVPPLGITTRRIGTVSIWERSSYYCTWDQSPTQGNTMDLATPHKVGEGKK